MPLAARAQVRRGRSAAKPSTQRVRPARERAIAEPLLRAVIARLGFLIDVGLDYLTLDRSAQTLSAAKASASASRRRSAPRSSASSTCSTSRRVGLHARDNARLLEAQARLRDLGNTRPRRRARPRRDPRGRSRRRHGPRRRRARRHDRRGGHAARSSWRTRSRSPARSSRGKKQLADPDATRKADGKRTSASSARARTTCERHRRDPARASSRASPASRGSGKSSLIVDTLLPAARAKLYSRDGARRRVRRASRASTTSTRSSRSIRRRSAARRARTRRRTPASSRSSASSTRACPRRARAATRRAASRST